MNDTLRPPACAGKFYPADTDELERTVRDHLADGPTLDSPPRALIGPHAGYIYSGSVAGAAYHTLRDHSEHFKRVLLAGPSHYNRFEGLASSPADAFATPLGEVPLAVRTIQELAENGYVDIDPEPHRREHSLETHLPFLQTLVDDFDLLPVVTGDADPTTLRAVLEEAWDDEHTLIAISSDLSHYLDYQTACAVDRKTCQAIEQKRYSALAEGSACGRTAIQALLRVAEERGADVHTLDLRNSGDTAGDRDQVVGYGAWALT